jgi:putative Holliday junction resolvase
MNAVVLHRILAIDLGIKRTGLAICDELGLTTRALPVLTPKSRLEDIRHILGVCREYDVKLVLVGYPIKPISGDEGPMARRARGFAEALTAEAPDDIKVELVDEHLTSNEAAKRIVRRRQSLDGEAACVMIEDYIQNRKALNG